MKTISFRVSWEFDRQLRIAPAKCDLNRSAFIRQTLTEKLIETEHQQANLSTGLFVGGFPRRTTATQREVEFLDGQVVSFAKEVHYV